MRPSSLPLLSLLSLLAAVLAQPVQAFSSSSIGIVGGATMAQVPVTRMSNSHACDNNISNDINKNFQNRLRNIVTCRGGAGLTSAAVVDSSVLKVMWNMVTTTLQTLTKLITSLTPSQKALLLATFFLGFAAGRVRPFWKRYTDVNDIPGSLFDGTTVLTGRAAKVTDGDTIRFLHQPTPWHAKVLRKGKEKLSDTALPIRICSIDTPETAKFGKKGQPFGEEAKEALQEFIGEGQKVYIKLLQKDQYSRAVAQVYIQKGPLGLLGKQYVDEHLLKLGLAEVYRGGGAVYGPKGLDGYTDLENKAKDNKLGIWSMAKRESAAEYKKRTKE